MSLLFRLAPELRSDTVRQLRRKAPQEKRRVPMADAAPQLTHSLGLTLDIFIRYAILEDAA